MISQGLSHKGTLTVYPLSASMSTKVKSFFGDAKLYCKVCFGLGILESTPVGSKHLTWTSELGFHGYPYEPFHIEICQQNLIAADVTIGKCDLNLNEVIQAGELTTTLPIIKEGSQIGELKVKVTWKPDQISNTNNVYYVPTNIINNQVQMGQPLNQKQSAYLNQGLLQPQYVQGYGQVLFGFPPMQQVYYPSNGMDENVKDVSEKDCPDMKNEEKCVICCENKKAGVFYKCGHSCCCNSCGKKFIGSSCPICRQPVYDFIKTFDT